MDILWWISALGAGILGAMGVGGGTILVVYLALFTDLSQRAAQTQNLLFFLPLAACSLWFHAKAGLLELSMVKKALPFGFLGVLAGFGLSCLVDDFWLRKAFALFLLVIGLKELFGAKQKKK